MDGIERQMWYEPDHNQNTRQIVNTIRTHATNEQLTSIREILSLETENRHLNLADQKSRDQLIKKSNELHIRDLILRL